MPEASEQEGTCPTIREGKEAGAVAPGPQELKPPYLEWDVAAVVESGTLETEAEVGYTTCQPPISESQFPLSPHSTD